MSAAIPPAPGDSWSPLAALGAALQARGAGDPRPLAELLAAFPEAAQMLTDALLDLPAAKPPEAPTSPPATEPAASGATHLGPYRLERELGRGGQAVVFAAIDTRLGRRVALKVLRADVFWSKSVESRFRAEAMVTSRLDHPGICPIYEIGNDGDQLYLAMRHVDGRTLAAHIAAARAAVTPGRPFALELGHREGPDDSTARRVRPWLPTLRLLESAARALHAAHLAGITHRDFKPGNLMVQRDGSGVVLDFGLAGDASRAGATLTRTGEVFGTPAYMAPEQCRNAKAADARSDVFALGATLYEAVTGERAFPGDTPEQVVRRILSGRVPDPRRLIPGLPRELSVIVGKSLDPEPERRYATAAAFADDLERVRLSRPILAEPPSALLIARRWVQRNQAATVAALVILVGSAISIAALRTARDRDLQIDHLSLRQTMEDLGRDYAALLPIPEHIAAARAWQARATAMLERRGEVQAAVNWLRRNKATPAGAAQKELALSNAEATLELKRLQEIEASLALSAGTPAALDGHRASAAQRAATRERLQAELAAIPLFVFEVKDEDSRRQHDALTSWLVEVERFAGADGPLASVERELAALTDTQTATWQQVIESIDYLPERLTPQTGLQPLRRNPTTGLWEFVHLRSGSSPNVRADGTLEVTPESGIVLVLLPGGTFTAGSQGTEPLAANYSTSVRAIDDYQLEVTLRPFFLAAHEVTQAQWQRLGGGTPSVHRVALRSPDVHPVENLTWARAYEIVTRSGLTLPTDLQWEYAAWRSAPPNSAAAADAWQRTENLFDASAVQAGLRGFPPQRPESDGWARHAPVGSFQPGPLGLYDLFGNVQEWCLDCDTDPRRDLVRPGDGLWLAPPSDKHMLRGPSFLHGPGSVDFPTLRAAYMNYLDTTGVRAARELNR